MKRQSSIKQLTLQSQKENVTNDEERKKTEEIVSYDKLASKSEDSDFDPPPIDARTKFSSNATDPVRNVKIMSQKEEGSMTFH